MPPESSSRTEMIVQRWTVIERPLSLSLSETSARMGLPNGQAELVAEGRIEGDDGLAATCAEEPHAASRADAIRTQAHKRIQVQRLILSQRNARS